MANPLDRTWYNTLVDDNGSGTTGTIWNKAAVDSLMDAVDASLATAVDRSGAPFSSEIPFFTDADTIAAGSGLMALGTSYLGVNSTAGADTKAIGLTGAAAVNPARAASLYLAGNQFAGAPGFIVLSAGAGGAISLNRGGVASVQMLSDGVFSLLDGQLRFPATQKPSTDPNTFDDYREGVFAPTFIADGGQSGQTYSLQEGTFIKQGRMVNAFGRIIIATLGTFTGSLYLGNLPFMGANVYRPGDVRITSINTVNLSFSLITGQVATNGNFAQLFYIAGTGSNGFSPVPPSALISGTDLSFAITYQANL